MLSNWDSDLDCSKIYVQFCNTEDDKIVVKAVYQKYHTLKLEYIIYTVYKTSQ